MDRNQFKKIIFLFVCLASVSFSYGQDNYSDTNLISRFRPGFMWFFTGVNPAEAEKVRKYDRLMVGIHSNQLMGDSLKPYQKNAGASIGFFTQFAADIPLVKQNKMSFGIGLGYKFTSVRLNGSLIRESDTKSTRYINLENPDFSKTVFKVHELYVPLELRFRTGKWKHVKFHIGGRVGWQFSAKTKEFLKYTMDNTNTTITKKGFYDLNPLQLAGTARIGIRNWAIYGSYQFLPYFKHAQSTQLNGFELGIALSLF